jgi:hypothetical protein
MHFRAYLAGDGRYKGGSGQQSGYSQYGESNRDVQQTVKNKSSAGDSKDLTSTAGAGASKQGQRDPVSQRPRNGPVNTASGGGKQQGGSRIVNGQ